MDERPSLVFYYNSSVYRKRERERELLLSLKLSEIGGDFPSSAPL